MKQVSFLFVTIYQPTTKTSKVHNKNVTRIVTRPVPLAGEEGKRLS